MYTDRQNVICNNIITKSVFFFLVINYFTCHINIIDSCSKHQLFTKLIIF